MIVVKIHDDDDSVGYISDNDDYDGYVSDDDYDDASEMNGKVMIMVIVKSLTGMVIVDDISYGM